MKIFGYKEDDDYGMTCAVIIADSEDEARNILCTDSILEGKLFEIPFEKGFTHIGSYTE